ncbi:MAG: PLDc N-terminal domain-containing protein [Actinomycetaceae bacterium]|nr:PLDc N-terminal domain-containing protein [Actinomycetaceae bacterium]
MFRVILVILTVAITIFALADCARTPSNELPAKIPKALWLLLILVFTPLGGLGWILVSRVMQAEARGGQLNRGIWYSNESAIKLPSRSQTDTEPRILAPDDDPEFLWKLERDLQRKRREQQRATDETGWGRDDTATPTNDHEDSADEAPSADSPS